MNYIFASDAHGLGVEWTERVDDMVEKYPNAKIVFGGDYIDGHPFSNDTLNYVQYMQEQYDSVVLKGNHEDMMVKAFQEAGNKPNDSFYAKSWFLNGGNTTIRSLFGRSWSLGESMNQLHDNFSELVDWMDNLPTIYETENIVFVHAGLNLFLQDPVKDTPEDERLWIRDDYYFIPGTKDYAQNTTGKTIISGHTPTSEITGASNNKVVVVHNGRGARIFADGGISPQAEGNLGNIVVLAEDGTVLDKME